MGEKGQATIPYRDGTHAADAPPVLLPVDGSGEKGQAGGGQGQGSTIPPTSSGSVGSSTNNNQSSG